MENTEEIYTDFARVYDELMDNTPYEMWCERLDRLIPDPPPDYARNVPPIMFRVAVAPSAKFIS